MNFEIKKNSDNIELLHNEKFMEYICAIPPNQKMSLEELESLLNFYKENNDQFIQNIFFEGDSKILYIKEKESGWRKPIEISFKFTPIRSDDVSKITEKKLDYIIQQLENENALTKGISCLEENLGQRIQQEENRVCMAIERLDTAKDIVRIQDQLDLTMRKLDQCSLEEQGKKLDTLISTLDNILPLENAIEKLNNITNKIEKTSNCLKLNIQQIETYKLYDSDDSDVNYTGTVISAYGGDTNGNIELLKNNNFSTGFGLNNMTGHIIIHKSGLFSELILACCPTGGWNTNYFNNCTLIFYYNYDVVAVFKLTVGNSNVQKFHGIPMGFSMTKLIICGYCSFSKVAFKS